MRIVDLNIAELLARYVEIGLQQSEATLDGEVERFNLLFDEMIAVENELQMRDGDQRYRLVSLYEHANAQVRLNAIKATLAVAPQIARGALEALAESREYPQSMDAGMCIRALDDGTFKPT